MVPLRPSLAALACLTVIALVLVAAGQEKTAPTASPEPFRPVGSVSDIMVGHGMALDALRRFVPDEAAEHRLSGIQKSAGLLAELSNVNTEHAKEDDYRRLAMELRTLSLSLRDAAAREDANQLELMGLYTRIDTACGACHEIYN